MKQVMIDKYAKGFRNSGLMKLFIVDINPLYTGIEKWFGCHGDVDSEFQNEQVLTWNPFPLGLPHLFH